MDRGSSKLEQAPLNNAAGFLAKAKSHKLDRQQATSYYGIITERKIT
jgi:hypothetical protein